MNKKTIFIITLNLILALDVAIIASIGILYGAGEGQLGTYVIGWGYFKPFTMDSNIFAGLVAFFTAVFCIFNKRGEQNRIPNWLMSAYLMANTCLLLTFLVAAAFLAPVELMSSRNYFVIFSGDMFFFHFLNPLLATISLLFCLRQTHFSRFHRLLGMLPTIVYSIVYFVMVVLLKRWDDFYHFTFGGKFYLVPLVVAVIYGVAYLSAYLLIRLHNKFVDNGL